VVVSDRSGWRVVAERRRQCLSLAKFSFPAFTGQCPVLVNLEKRCNAPLSSKREITNQLKHFGANVRRERVAAGLTQEKLAEKADLNIRTLQSIEAGEMNLLVTTALRIQRALRCEWQTLFD